MPHRKMEEMIFHGRNDFPMENDLPMEKIVFGPIFSIEKVHISL